MASLSSLQLDAFQELVRAGSFTRAARALHITQSALSQRILNLEEELGTTLLVRESSGIRLTADGQALLRYGVARSALENEFLDGLRAQGQAALAGAVRLGGFSTVVRSVALPILSELARSGGESVRIELFTREVRDVPGLLRSGEADLILADAPSDKTGIESHLLGYEENVLVEPSRGSAPEGVYLDHDSDDETTHRFFALQNARPKKLVRCFLDEIYGIIDGVALGVGRAVVPRHLIQSDRRVQVVRGLKPMKVPVYLSYYRQSFLPKLQERAITLLREKASAFLSSQKDKSPVSR